MAFITDLTAAVPTTGVYIDGLPSGVDNRQGSIPGGGTIADSTNFSATAFGEGNPITTIVSGVGGAIGTNDALPSTAWNSGVQVMSLDQTIAGAANTAIQGGSSDSANEANTPLSYSKFPATVLDGTELRNGAWNIYSGTWSTTPAVTYLGAMRISPFNENPATMVGWDIAATPTQDIPGRITIQDGSANPVQTGYGPRYNW